MAGFKDSQGSLSKRDGELEATYGWLFALWVY